MRFSFRAHSTHTLVSTSAMIARLVPRETIVRHKASTRPLVSLVKWVDEQYNHIGCYVKTWPDILVSAIEIQLKCVDWYTCIWIGLARLKSKCIPKYHSIPKRNICIKGKNERSYGSLWLENLTSACYLNNLASFHFHRPLRTGLLLPGRSEHLPASGSPVPGRTLLSPAVIWTTALRKRNIHEPYAGWRVLHLPSRLVNEYCLIICWL